VKRKSPQNACPNREKPVSLVGFLPQVVESMFSGGLGHSKKATLVFRFTAAAGPSPAS